MTLVEMLEAARKRTEAMTPEEREAMFASQRRRYVEAEISWPCNFHYENGVKVYDSYTDYCA